MHFLNVEDLSQDLINELLGSAERFERSDGLDRLVPTPLLASCFFQPSTRTRLSTESAMLRLGGQVISVTEVHQLRHETLQDILQCVAGYAHIIALRHPNYDSVSAASKDVGIPIINCGAGSISHPTQTLADLYIMKKVFHRLKGLKILLLGDFQLRAARSLIAIRRVMGLEIDICTPTADPKELDWLRCETDIRLVPFASRNERYAEYDVIYVKPVTDINYHSASLEYELSTVQSKVLLSAHDVSTYVRPESIILHALPRFGELEPEVDSLPQAQYFELARAAVFVRMAVLEWLLRLRYGSRFVQRRM